MARAIWSGSISFGLVNVPVKAYTAARDHEIHFHQLEHGSGARIRYKKVSDTSGHEVDPDKIELGYELSKGRYVTIDPDELDALRPRSTRSIDISDFVALDDIDPVYYDHTYWLAPADGNAERPYRLLLAAMEDRRRVGIGTVVMRRKQYLAAIRPLDGALAVSTMRFADEIVDKDQGVEGQEGGGQEGWDQEGCDREKRSLCEEGRLREEIRGPPGGDAAQRVDRAGNHQVVQEESAALSLL